MFTILRKGDVNVYCCESRFNTNQPIDCYALMKPSFCHILHRFSVTMEPDFAIANN